MPRTRYEPGRRRLLSLAALAGLTHLHRALATDAKPALRVPYMPLHVDAARGLASGPYGEMQTWRVGDQLLPVFLAAAGGGATMDCRRREARIRYGRGVGAIMVTSRGVRFGTGRLAPWSGATVKALTGALASDRTMLRDALHLRATLHLLFPLALRAAKASGEQRAATALASRARTLGADAMRCTTQTLTETVEREVVRVVEVVRSAEQQWQACYDRELRGSCRFTPVPAACAAGICALTTFIDLVVGVAEIVERVAEQVTREVIACALPRPGNWPNPWTVLTGGTRSLLPQGAAAFSPATLAQAAALLGSLAGFLGPFASGLLSGTWTLAQLETPLDLGSGALAIPYGVSVCLDADTASRVALDKVFGLTLAGWKAALGVLAALSPEFALFAADIGIAKSGAVGAVLATLAPEAVPVVSAAMAVLLAFVLLAMIYATAISAQLLVHKEFTDHFADGTVCIEHPTFALALIKIASWSLAPAELIPPIVVG